jgi:hypothetical protein
MARGCSSLLLITSQRSRRQVWQNRIGSPLEHIQSVGIRRKLVSIDETAIGFVEGVGRQPVVDVELPRGFDSFAEGTNKPVNLLLRGLRSGHRIRASQPGKILTEGMAGNERMKIAGSATKAR